MSETPLGKWLIVRSDRGVLSVDKADHVYYIGRGRQLPSPQQLSHAYVSREHLAVVWHPPHLYIAQTGKNPSFIGTACDEVPRLATGQPNASTGEETTASMALTAASVRQHAQLLLTPSSTTSEATMEKSTSGALTVTVPLSDPLTVTRAPDSLIITAATIYFPEQLRTPSLTVRFESAEVNREDATAVATTKTAAEMLAVPAFGNVSDDDEEDKLSDEEHSRTSKRSVGASAGNAQNAETTEAEERPEWRGRLDVAMQEQQRQDAAAGARLSEGQRVEKTEAPAPPEVVTAAPSTAVPFGGTEKINTNSDSTATAAPVSAVSSAACQPSPHASSPPAPPHQHMGFWEWNCHANGNVDDPKSWRKYNRAVAELLEKSYRDATIAKIKIPDSAMFDKPGAKGSTYGVCFAEKALHGAMIQYSLENPGKFRVIRRTGGTPVDRKNAKRAHVIPSSSSESESEDSASDDDDDSDSEESVSPSSRSSSSDSDEEPQKKRRRC